MATLESIVEAARWLVLSSLDLFSTLMTSMCKDSIHDGTG